MSYQVLKLPPREELETIPLLKKAIEANRVLAELKGVTGTLPNASILVDSLILTEAKESSAVENIVTTHDALYSARSTQEVASLSTKEVLNYASALKTGFALIQEQGLLLNRHILQIQEELEANNAGFRTQAGTSLRDAYGNLIYMPPQDAKEIKDLMANLEAYINEPEMDHLDPLIKMAVIHFQFESIHPFYDGNGRTGRIINILYLCTQKLLDYPILYLSKYIIATKAAYYERIQAVRDHGDWTSWVLYILEGVIQTARSTIQNIQAILRLMKDYKDQIQARLPRIYSKDLLEHLFKHVYTRVEHLQLAIGKSESTARRYLEQLFELGFLEKRAYANSHIYINPRLFSLLTKI
ncbi:Fic family protein [Saprospira grandis]|uniref:Filamentation induced by cAMP protein Fic n=1 Tax=Saprospira grandis (strain Lewin) TaxID=984262 RepID=H6L328_SAPGL|nr:Fic family protein [Saprospira grandis]AFC24855.1 filamentation induced by cAMP protein Fic [Saprospira grandis str. Lewin]WBM76241.1 Fic family protein [Saprospira grandis]